MEFSYSPWLLLPGALLALAAAGWAYWPYLRPFFRRGQPVALPAYQVSLLTGLRLLALLLVVLLLIGPVASLVRERVEKPIVAVVVDNSQSMVASRDSAYVRQQLPQNIEALTRALARRDAEVSLLSFDLGVHPLAATDSLRFNQQGTDVARALDEVTTLMAQRNLAAVVLVSDGISTEGGNPVLGAGQLLAPVYTVLVGDTLQQKDIRIEAVLVNDIAYKGAETPLRAEIRSFGFAAQQVEVRLMQAGRVLERRKIQLPADGNAEADFIVKPAMAGMVEYEVAVEVLPGEFTARNNRQRAYINVLETKQKIVLLAGGPHPDIGALEAALGQLDRYEVVTIARKDEANFYRNPTPADLAESGLFILHNFPSSMADRDLLKQVLAQVDSRQVPLFHIVGTRTLMQAMQGSGNYMGIALQGGAVRRATETLLQLTPAYRYHSTFTFDENFYEWLADAPPLLRPDGDWQPRPGAEVFGTANIRGFALAAPMFAIQETQGRKSVTLLGEGLWKYRAYDFSSGKSFTRFDTWMQNLVQWLVVKDDRRKFKVRAARPLFQGNQPVLFKGQAYDDSYRPLADAEIKLVLTDSSKRKQEYFLRQAAPGSYLLELPPLPEGAYSYEATGRKDSREIGRDAGRFSVGRSMAEYVRLQADAGQLRQLSVRTGGRMVLARDMASLADSVVAQAAFRPMLQQEVQSTALHDHLWPLLLLLAFLSAEWILRKRWGLA